ncbi:MAG: metal-dependent hydrolase [Actinomycetota bacterium]|nr:metal-dependent hydrolase [Actinomycetota bacterium]
MAGELTWLGHAAFRLDTPGGKRIYIDPWLSNPRCPENEREPERIDVIAITHGHTDHIGEAVELARRHRPAVVAIFELTSWLEAQGVEGASQGGMNKGGTQEVDGIRFTMTHALHSGGFVGEGAAVTYLGDPAGFVVELEDGTTVYFAGDTAVFSDMQLIGRLYEPDLAVLPIGDHFTMGPREAAVAVELLGVRRVFPSHYGTFPLLTGRPEQLREQGADVELLDAPPGETVRL